MQNRQLFINGYSVDFFSDEELIPLILQVNDFGDIQSLQGHGSKLFKLPLTQKNRMILGFPDDITITDNTPYTQLPSKYISDGIEVVANGLAEIQDVQDNYVDVMLLFGNIDLLDKLGGQIYDMGDSTTYWSGYGTNKVWDAFSLPFPDDLSNIANCIFDVPHAAYSQQKTSGWIWPIVNYGEIDTTPPFAGHINVRNLRPGFFLHSAIELLIQSTGYTINKEQSCIYNDPIFANLYPKLIIQFSNSDFEHGADFQNTPDNLGATFKNGIDQVISRPRSDLGKPWNQSNIYENDAPFSNVLVFSPSDAYTTIKNVDITASLNFDLFVRGRLAGSQATEVIIKFTLVDAMGVITDFASTSYFLDDSSTVVYPASFFQVAISEQEFLNQKLSQDFQLVPGDKLYVRCHINNIGQDRHTDTYVIFRNSAVFSIVSSEKLVLWEQPIQCEKILPAISQLDLLKDTLRRFDLILISDPNTNMVIFTSLKKVISNKPIARDWSEKCKDMGRKIVYQLGNYAQDNWLRYQLDDAIPLNLMPKYFADDNIPIADKTLSPTEPVKDLYVSIFAPSLNATYIGGTTAQISDPNNTDSFSVGNQPRLLIDQKLNISTKGTNGNPLTVTFSDADAGFETVNIPINDIISVPYFYKQDAPDLSPAASHLSWNDKGGMQGLRSIYYPELEDVLKQTKKVTRYFYLTPADILDFDFNIPVYLRQDGAYYYVSKIDSWINGFPCKVDLIKLG